ncbi:Transmembrane osmosensor, partial [Rhizopus stolonifer]
MDPAPAGIAEQHSPTINNPPNEPTQPSPVEYREKVQALHAYQANPEDPNELNFSKGEILDIVDKTGNWWQA